MSKIIGRSQAKARLNQAANTANILAIRLKEQRETMQYDFKPQLLDIDNLVECRALLNTLNQQFHEFNAYMNIYREVIE